MNELKIYFISITIFFGEVHLSSQEYFGALNDLNVCKIDINQSDCFFTCLSPGPSFSSTGMTLTPDNLLIGLFFRDLYLIDQVSGISTLYFPIPLPYPDATFRGLVSTNSDIYYSVAFESGYLYALNVR